MSAMAIALTVLACVCQARYWEPFFCNLLPHDNLSPGSQEAVKLGLGFVGTMSALVLGLLISSAKASYDAVNSEMTQMSARVIFLDRVLALYGPETKDARVLLRTTVVRTRDKLWPQESGRRPEVGPTSPCRRKYAWQDSRIVAERRPAAFAPRPGVELGVWSQ